MSRLKPHAKIPLLLTFLTVLLTVLPAVAACRDADCCPEGTSAEGCESCLLGSCGEEVQDTAVVGPGLVLEQPPEAIEQLCLDADSTRIQTGPAVCPTLAAVLAVTVLRI